VKRSPGFYWVVLVHLPGVATIARWNGREWSLSVWDGDREARVRKVLSGRLAPPGKDGLQLPLKRVLLDSGKGYREELKVDRVNHATGAVFVSRRSES
jgi:hypothetical protein